MKEVEKLYELPHVSLVQNENNDLVLIVEDTELNDYIDDYLWDNFQLDEYAVESRENKSLDIYYNYYQPKDLENLISALAAIDTNEIERIYKLNN